jgi:hypothetical protein
MKKLLLGVVLTVCLASCALAQTNSQIHAARVFDGKITPSGQCAFNTPCFIDYNGGPVFEKTPTNYIIWYGKWTAKDKSIIDYYFAHVGGTTQNKINTIYTDDAGKSVPITVKHSTKNDYHDNYSMGKNLGGDGQIQTIVANAIANHHLPADANGIYFVLTYTDVNLPGLCSSFCGYHSPSVSIVSGKVIKYSMVGNSAKCPDGCEASRVVGDSGSPNNDPGADGTVSIMWHEFSETVSDPDAGLNNAWRGSYCGETGDCCDFIFGNLKKDSNGHLYTNTIGTKHFITQEMFKLKKKTRGVKLPGVCKQVY